MEPRQPPSKSKRKAELTPKARALRLLARREYTRPELERKLAPYVEQPAELGDLLDELTDRGWLSEARAVEQLVHAKRTRFGSARIRQSMIEKGVSVERIAATLHGLRETELAAAHEIWLRKFKTPPDTPAARARQVRFLRYRGFSLGIAMRVVGGQGRD